MCSHNATCHCIAKEYTFPNDDTLDIFQISFTLIENVNIFKKFLDACTVVDDKKLHKDDFTLDNVVLKQLCDDIHTAKPEDDIEKLPLLQKLSKEQFKLKSQIQCRSQVIEKKLEELRASNRYFEQYHERTDMASREFHYQQRWTQSTQDTHRNANY